MNAKSDIALLREFVTANNQGAFEEIAARYTDLVYAAARRQCGSNELALDVSQNVFHALARKAPLLIHQAHPSLAGWLYQSTRYEALNLLRVEKRRHMHEMQAIQHMDTTPKTETSWEAIAPVLDEAMDDLSHQDREILLLRFFKNLDFRTAGSMLGLSDDAAQKRAARAVEKLRICLNKKGVFSSTGSIAAALIAHSAPSAPAGMAAVLAGNATACAVAAKATTFNLIKTMILSKIKIGALTALLLGGGSLYYVQNRALTELRDENTALRRQVAETIARHNAATNESLEFQKLAKKNDGQLAELLKLRGEVGQLRRQNSYLQSLKTANSQPSSSRSANKPEAAPTPAAPFQIQLVVDEPGDDTQSLTNIDGKTDPLNVQSAPLLSSSAVQSARVIKGESGSHSIEVEFTAEGRDQFAKITRDNINKRLAIVMDGQLYSAPMIRSEIPGGKAMVSGNFTEDEAKKLADKINEMLSGK